MRRAPTTSPSWSTSRWRRTPPATPAGGSPVYGPQAELARLSGVAVDERALDEIVQQRALGWMLALAGVGPERDWRSGAMGHASGATAGAEPVRRYVARSLREFRRRRGATFKLLLLRR